MLGTGSINGSVVNAQAIGGGGFQVPGAGAADIGQTSTLSGVARRGGVAISSTSLEAGASPVRRRSSAGAAAVSTVMDGSARRRCTGHGAAIGSHIAAGSGRARLAGFGQSEAIVTGALRGRYHFLHRAPHQRYVAIRGELRAFTIGPRAPDLGIAPELRSVAQPAAQRLIEVPAQPRLIVLPTDGGADVA